MSGRKASEVTGLLRNGENTRSALMNSLRDISKKAEHAIKAVHDVEKRVALETKGAELGLSDAARKEFPDAARQLEERWTAFTKSCSLSKIAYKSKEYDKIMERYGQADEEADRLRSDLEKKIRGQSMNDPWYCDAEYARAETIQKKYNKLAGEANALRNRYSGMISAAAVLQAGAYEKLEQAKALKKAAAELEERAKVMKALRERASEVKSRVRDEFEKIDSKLAEKFLSKEFGQLRTELKEFLGFADREIIKNCSSMLSKLAVFENTLRDAHGRYLEQQRLARAEIDSLLDRMNQKIYSHPEDEFKELEDPSRESLIGFLELYGKGRYVGQLGQMRSQAEDLFASERFDEARALARQAEKTVDEASAFAALTRVNRMKTIFNMLSIQQAMVDLHYDVRVEENADRDDGYRIECVAGDENILFERVAVVGNGEAVIDIDHKEAAKGTCGASWWEIRRRLSEEGLFLEDITKDGKSVLFAETEQPVSPSDVISVPQTG